MKPGPARIPAGPALAVGLALLGGLSAAVALAAASWDGPEGEIGLVGDGIPRPLTGGMPDAARGREVTLSVVEEDIQEQQLSSTVGPRENDEPL